MAVWKTRYQLTQTFMGCARKLFSWSMSRNFPYIRKGPRHEARNHLVSVCIYLTCAHMGYLYRIQTSRDARFSKLSFLVNKQNLTLLKKSPSLKMYIFLNQLSLT